MSGLQFLIPLALAVAGFFAGIQWEQGKHAQELLAAQANVRHLFKQIDEKGIEHAAAEAELNRRNAALRREVYSLAGGRDCLSGRAVGLLNSIGLPAPSTAASAPQSAPTASATDRDVGDALAICRSEHDRLAGQLNAILDIEEARQNQR
jgi:hypothetical protein